jgi:hypothetical protein
LTDSLPRRAPQFELRPLEQRGQFPGICTPLHPPSRLIEELARSCGIATRLANERQREKGVGDLGVSADFALQVEPALEVPLGLDRLTLSGEHLAKGDVGGSNLRSVGEHVLLGEFERSEGIRLRYSVIAPLLFDVRE